MTGVESDVLHRRWTSLRDIDTLCDRFSPPARPDAHMRRIGYPIFPILSPLVHHASFLAKPSLRPSLRPSLPVSDSPARGRRGSFPLPSLLLSMKSSTSTPTVSTHIRTHTASVVPRPRLERVSMKGASGGHQTSSIRIAPSLAPPPASILSDHPHPHPHPAILPISNPPRRARLQHDQECTLPVDSRYHRLLLFVLGDDNLFAGACTSARRGMPTLYSRRRMRATTPPLAGVTTAITQYTSAGVARLCRGGFHLSFPLLRVRWHKERARTACCVCHRGA
ncbi:hypothetical protein C8R47DRAFT_1320664 [Mycena vitilis]|nr:hypothetical protein C8R47DRAFT_1320664 [Mycena vitilis]